MNKDKRSETVVGIAYLDDEVTLPSGRQVAVTLRSVDGRPFTRGEAMASLRLTMKALAQPFEEE
jgi:hypothetical protein